ncbi:Centrin [Spironucleus salmonicida]|uniref:Centrin n=1 Tax=Spironucleus salmonicida TaxID=348837 RepID=V6LX34_9EUKA|nr:Centrin [Spironucleus salmonicida]|eukprot:EST49172.1 Centrin [Spironucleus salmonicida]
MQSDVSLLTLPQRQELIFAFNSFAPSNKLIQPQDIHNIILTLDIPNQHPPKTAINLDQFLEFFQPLIAERDNVDDQVKAFKILDDSQEGVLTVRKLTQAGNACGLDLTIEEAQDMLNMVAPSVGEGEFLRILNRIQ